MELPSLLSNAELLFSFAFSEVIDAVKISFGWEGICRPGRKKRERERERAMNTGTSPVRLSSSATFRITWKTHKNW